MGRAERIAVVDDDPDMQDYYRTILPTLGREAVGVARIGPELVNLCRSKRPDIVIVDLKTPDVDGVEAVVESARPAAAVLTCQIRASPGACGPTASLPASPRPSNKPSWRRRSTS